MQRFTLLQQKIEAAEERAEAAEAENKKVSSPTFISELTLQYQQTLLERDQEISSLQHKLSLAEEEADKAEEKLKELKGSAEEGDTHRTASENYQRKVQLLEEELDKAEKDLKETTEKLRQVDVKAEHFERAFQRAEQERDEWERKHGVSTHGPNQHWSLCTRTHKWRQMARTALRVACCVYRELQQHRFTALRRRAGMRVTCLSPVRISSSASELPFGISHTFLDLNKQLTMHRRPSRSSSSRSASSTRSSLRWRAW